MGKKLEDDKWELRGQWDEKWTAYKDQQRLLKYINDAEEKISFLKKKEEREKKRKEREAKIEAEKNAEVINESSKVEEEPFSYEIAMCDWLVGYFKNLSGVKAESSGPVKQQEV